MSARRNCPSWTAPPIGPSGLSAKRYAASIIVLFAWIAWIVWSTPMPNNPFTDAWHFLTANTGDYQRLGDWRFLVLALFWVLLLAGTALAFRNWQEDSA